MIIYYKRVFKNLPLRAIGANFFLILSGCIVLSTSSCNKSSVIGLDVQPNTNHLDVTFSDTTTLITKTVRTGEIRTDEIATQSITSDVLIGTYLDPVFGKTMSSLYTQLRLNYFPSFGNNPQIDSVILSLTYDTSYYGKKPYTPQNISVHEITEAFSTTNSYYSSDTLSIASTDLANNFKFFPNPTLSNTLRIPLNSVFGEKILNTPVNASFLNYLNGLYITTQNTTGLNSGDGNILRFKMNNPQTQLTLYYHNDSASSLTFYFSFNSVIHFTNFKHDYSSVDADLASQLGNAPPVQNNVLFIQPLAGTKVKIEMPYLMNWLKEGKIGINLAELMIKINTSPSYPLTPFSVPSNLIIVGINDDGSTYLIPDIYENYYGGIYDSTTYEYNFSITRYIQQVLNGKLHNNGIYLMVTNEFINPSRVVIGGGGNGNSYQMKLNITHTKIP